MNLRLTGAELDTNTMQVTVGWSDGSVSVIEVASRGDGEALLRVIERAATNGWDRGINSSYANVLALVVAGPEDPS